MNPRIHPDAKISRDAQIHESVYVDAGAVVWEGTRIWHFTHVRENAQIGMDCRIGANCEIGPHVIIMNRCAIQNNVSIYAGVGLCDNVFIGPSVVFTNDLWPRADQDGESWRPLQTLVCNGASIGANATILAGICIGEYAMIGAGAVVTKDVDPYTVVAGNPAVKIGDVDGHGGAMVKPEPIQYLGPACGTSGRPHVVKYGKAVCKTCGTGMADFDGAPWRHE